MPMHHLAHCTTCGKALATDEANLSRKLLGIQTQDGYCLACLAASTGSTPAQLQQDIDRYRAEGCLFFLD